MLGEAIVVAAGGVPQLSLRERLNASMPESHSRHIW